MRVRTVLVLAPALLALAFFVGSTTHQSHQPATGPTASRASSDGRGGSAHESGAGSGGTSGHPVSKSYLATDDSTWVDFIQWAENPDGGVYGTIQEDILGGTAGSEAVSTATDPVTGQISGTNVTVSIGSSDEMFGTFSHGMLRLDIPQQDGTIALSTFISASPAAFTNAVQFLQVREYNDNQSALAREEVAAQESAIDAAASTVRQDLSKLARDQARVASALVSFPTDLAREKADLAATASVEQKVVGESHAAGPAQNQAEICSEVARVSSDAERVHSDGIGVGSSLGFLRRDVGTTQPDFQVLVAAEQPEPSYQDGAPTVADVAQAVGAANAAITSAAAVANGDIATANRYTSQAFQDANAAQGADHCGAASTPPTPGQPTR